jgi:MoaA/NifB/PqqE/SkfB family radical SAM enzyme
MSQKPFSLIKPLDVLMQFRERGIPDQFCIVPFVNLIFNPSGSVGVCRQKGTEHSVGHLDKESIEEIWNGPTLKSWREEFLTGNIKTCKDEISRDHCNLMVDNYKNLWPEIVFSTEQQLPMLRFTANFNGKCNLRCKMCHIWTMQNGYYDTINFWETAQEQFFPFIKEMELLSGEPFIQKDTYRLIDQVSLVNSDCQWSFTTNGHWQLTSGIMKSLDKIKIRDFIVSIDSFLPERYAQIRLDGDLTIVMKNLHALKKYEASRLSRGLSSLNLTIHFLVMKDNWDELSAVLDLVDSLNFKLVFNNLYRPDQYALSSMPEAEQRMILDHYLASYPWSKLSRMMTVITPILEALPKTDRAHYLLDLKLKKDAALYAQSL